MAWAPENKKMVSTMNDVAYRVNWEGFDYAMISYSDWKEVEDPAFQEKLKAYKAAREELAAYIEANDPKKRRISR